MRTPATLLLVATAFALAAVSCSGNDSQTSTSLGPSPTPTPSPPPTTSLAIVGNYTFELRISSDCGWPITVHRWPVTVTYDGEAFGSHVGDVLMPSDFGVYRWGLAYNYRTPAPGAEFMSSYIGVSTGGPGPGQIPGPITSDRGYRLAFSGSANGRTPTLNAAGRREILNARFDDGNYLWYNPPSGGQQGCGPYFLRDVAPGSVSLIAR